jgi:hypothetical protein
MFLDLILSFFVSLFSALGFSFLFNRLVLTRLFSLEDQVAVLEERHLSAVRRASIKNRWDQQDLMDTNIEKLASEALNPKPERWKKWGSKSASSSDESGQG